MQKRLIFSFIVTIILLIFLGFISILKMIELSNLTDKLYKHPFTVTNATKKIETNLVSMHRYMKDVALSKNVEELERIVEKVDNIEKVVYEEFNIVFDRYLGDKEDIQKSYYAFVSWKPIRDEVIALVREGKYDEASEITKYKGAIHLENLMMNVDALIQYANNKAIFFHENTIQSKKEATILVLIILVTILIILGTLFYNVINKLKNKEIEIQKYLHVIDQNIISVTLNKNLEIKSVSSAFLKELGFSQGYIEKDKGLLYLSNSFFEDKTIIENIKKFDSWKEEIKVLNANGKEIWLLSNIIPIYDEYFNIIEYNNILTDITNKKRIEEISLHDSLTSLYNRRHFDLEFPKMLNLINRTDLYIVFAMIDIDKFKEYNDTYGHQEGDNALKKVSETLLYFMKRKMDQAFRLGGEEFGLLFSTKKRDEVFKFLDSVREKVEDLKIEHKNNTASKYLTISMGVSVISKNDILDVDKIYRQTDEALYLAKDGGRNSIKFSKESKI